MNLQRYRRIPIELEEEISDVEIVLSQIAGVSIRRAFRAFLEEEIEDAIKPSILERLASGLSPDANVRRSAEIELKEREARLIQLRRAGEYDLLKGLSVGERLLSEVSRYMPKEALRARARIKEIMESDLSYAAKLGFLEGTYIGLAICAYYRKRGL